MELSQQNAMNIVTEISAIIGQHVNMMDDKGAIIASTDPKRIGTFHEGAATLVNNRLDELIIPDNSRFKGSLKGINLPLVLNGRVIGVIGVTGEYKEVMKYGQIIKKMTEAMMQENYQKEQKKIDDRIHARFLDEWVLEGAPVTPTLAERGARLNIDVRQPYRVLVAQIANFRHYSDTPEGQVMIDNINRRVRQSMAKIQGGVFAKTASKMICLFPGENSDACMERHGAAILKTVEQEFAVQLHIGIDGGEGPVHQSYQQASKAALACAQGECSIALYNNIGLEIFLGDISPVLRRTFVNRIFRGYSEKEVAQLVAALQVYFETNGSIEKTAGRLFLHKNTLQYKLKKMHEKTGYDPRNIAHSALIYLAVQFYLIGEN